ncbi:CPBP family intramembrane glutamic endopeptidase [Actinorugispora endophytica]|uniref:CAAX prenyl protease-like protein n=1 Tax=Actinorugispora endophytica TaxID=1605990 RepID=A0A4R6V6D2_9ACTN|nr:CPBP family intramembrane glutamic endopeptidase [Actinorugispora endophytica]TDQ54742.1 CAAX prenyl protease-like protein [Actinorugispora endophytica]
MARTERHHWWKPPLALFLSVVLVLALSVFVVFVVKLIAVIRRMPSDAALFGAPVPDLAAELVMLALMTPVVMFVVRVVQKRRIGSLSSVEGRLRWSWLLRCAGVAAMCVAVSFGYLIAVLLLTAPEEPVLGEYAGTRQFVLAMTVIVLLVPFQAAAEEYATRGFLMQLIGSYGSAPAGRAGLRAGARRPGPALAATANRFFASPVPSILVSGLVFAALHDYLDWAMADVALFGLAMAWLTWYTGGLEAAITLHVLHNVAAFAFSAYEGLPDPSGSTGSWQGFSASAIEVGLFCLVVVWMARRSRLRRSTSDPAVATAVPQAPHGGTAPGRD